MVIDYAGEVIWNCNDREEVKTVSLQKKDMIEFRTNYPFLADQDHFTIQT
jgi:hypothetical protein